MDFNNLCTPQLNVISHDTHKEKVMWLMARSLPSSAACSLLNKWIRVGKVSGPSQVFLFNMCSQECLERKARFKWGPVGAWLEVALFHCLLSEAYNNKRRGREEVTTLEAFNF